jgi:hypothetical protein
MSAVHDEIAMQALRVQPLEIQQQFEPYIVEFKKSSWYPDDFADRSMSKSAKDKIDPEADRFIYPLPPQEPWHLRLVELGKKHYSYSDAEPLSQFYLISFYLNHAVKSLRQGDVKSAIKFCGVYSHLLGDTAEPIHAMNPALLDVVIPPPHKFIGLELHANVEGLKAPVNISDYHPKLLGNNLGQAEMGAFAGLVKAHKFGAAQATPIVQALYTEDRVKATALSSLAQSEAARHFADFIYTVFSIANGKMTEQTHNCDLCNLPVIANSVDMLYRYQPIVDASLEPYSGGKMHPLSLLDPNGNIYDIHGLGVIPSLGPPFDDSNNRIADIDFFIVPGTYNNFSATVGLNPRFSESMPTAKFQILGDGKLLTTTTALKPGEAGCQLQTNLTDCRFLTLRMQYVHTPTFDKLQQVSKHLAWTSHGVWGKPELS